MENENESSEKMPLSQFRLYSEPDVETDKGKEDKDITDASAAEENAEIERKLHSHLTLPPERVKYQYKI